MKSILFLSLIHIKYINFLRMSSFFERNRFNFDIAGALLSMLMNVIGLYFVYRWGKLLQGADDETRRALLGETLANSIVHGEYIAIVIAVYLGYKMVLFLAQAADWRKYLDVAKRQQTRSI